MKLAPIVKTFFCLFGAIGGGALGFKDSHVNVGGLDGHWECLGSVDVDPAANRDFARLVGTRATDMDLMDREQYVAYHGHEPPPGWREATPDDIRRAAGFRRPNAVFLSAPCKGFSGLLSQAKSLTAKYQALNRLTLRGVWLTLEAWADDPPELILFENVPRLATRGRALLDQISAMLRAYGYAVAETTHDCGELGGLAQSRKRFLLVARHIAKVPNLLYEPPRRPLRAVGDVLSKMPLPGDLTAGPMHRVPQLSWKTWVRLAFVEAGKDWRSLNRLAVEDGVLRDYLIVPAMHNGGLGVRRWEDSTGVVAGQSLPMNGTFSVADVRFQQRALWRDGQAYGVRRWEDSTGAIAGQQGPGQGSYSVADPRHTGPAKHSNEFRIVRWSGSAMAVTSAHGTGQALADPRPAWDGRHGHLHVAGFEDTSRTVTAGGKGVQGGHLSVADPRPTAQGRLFTKYPVAGWGGSSGTVIAGDDCGAYAVADPRTSMSPDRAAYLTGGHLGVVPWSSSCGAVSAAACHDNGRWSVADPRVCDLVQVAAMPAANDRLVAHILAEDNTWHRPFTTLELAALQSLFDPEDPIEAAAFQLDGTSDQAWRERIGNAVPRASARAIADEMLRTLMLADAGETFQLSAAPVWVRPVAAALMLAQGEEVCHG
ncbi:DNA cytosine methyltransferase [Paucibacter sp. R3-3]|uniref:DNA cytosine methyltransferase n=1 Tax=Roseateles agri TaxID=3098619 RepID=A0ABU5DM02_9BURK|nr:DNA cytosine methyltransferase [Paucibacter sp. R3-3]MDY0747334.1 DNA cytosine methyltransferase [Paucibacter sp. R3-3]